MKKLIASALLGLVLSAPAQASDVRFHHWTVHSNQSMTNTLFDGDSFLRLGIDDGAEVFLIFDPKMGDTVGGVTGTDSDVIMVDGELVRVNVVFFDDGSLQMRPATDRGHKYIISRLWSQARVEFKIEGVKPFWFSAKGVQAAARYISQHRKAI
ncbi:MAG: hypothetical protein ACRC8D_07195 [Aeromonas sp.]